MDIEEVAADQPRCHRLFEEVDPGSRAPCRFKARNVSRSDSGFPTKPSRARRQKLAVNTLCQVASVGDGLPPWPRSILMVLTKSEWRRGRSRRQESTSTTTRIGPSPRRTLKLRDRRRRGSVGSARVGKFDLSYIKHRRQHRLHGQRRRPGDGDHGHHQAARRRAGQLSRRRRRRHEGAVTNAFKILLSDEKVKARAGQHLRRHHAAATTSRQRAWSRAARARRAEGAARCASRRDQRREGQAAPAGVRPRLLIAADDMDDAAEKIVAARSLEGAQRDGAQPMSVLGQRAHTKVIVQGFTGKAGGASTANSAAPTAPRWWPA